MSSININSLLARVAPQRPIPAQRGIGPTGGEAPKQQEQQAVQFTRGEYWKNFAADPMVSGKESSPVYSRPAGQRPLQGEGQVAGSEGQVTGPNDGSQEVSENFPAGQSDNVSPEDPSQPTQPNGTPLSEADRAVVAELKKVDQNVRTHEQAHLAAAGGIAKGGASFTYKRGPDGNNYAVGGEVQIDMSKEASPEANIKKMRQVRMAALAPADPSPQDQKVAAQATVSLAQAMKELNLDDSSSATQGVPLAGKDQQAENEQAASEITKRYGQELVAAAQNNGPLVPKRFIQNYQQSPSSSSGISNLSFEA